MASKIDIINRALSKLAQARITSLSDNTPASKLVNAIYDQVAEDVISEGSWTSCIRRATLAQAIAPPDWGYDFQYQLPTDPKCLRVLTIDEGRQGSLDYQIEGDKLLTNETSISIHYIAFIEDTEAYDSFLRQAITWALVAEMVYNFSGKDTTALSLAKTAEEKKQYLLSLNNLQGRPGNLDSSYFIDSRYE